MFAVVVVVAHSFESRFCVHVLTGPEPASQQVQCEARTNIDAEHTHETTIILVIRACGCRPDRGEKKGLGTCGFSVMVTRRTSVPLRLFASNIHTTTTTSIIKRCLIYWHSIRITHIRTVCTDRVSCHVRCRTAYEIHAISVSSNSLTKLSALSFRASCPFLCSRLMLINIIDPSNRVKVRNVCLVVERQRRCHANAILRNR